jgi:PilZ domain
MNSFSHTLDCVPLPDMNDLPSPDLRRSPRVPCRVPVTLRRSNGRDISAICVDVNASGIATESDSVLAVGERVKLLVLKQNGEVRPVPMLVMYRMERYYGLSALEGFEDVLDLLPTQA